jgi:predicted methyltransferase
MKKVKFNPNNEYFTFMLRNIPADVYSKIKYYAILKKVSMNNVINDILKEFTNYINAENK